MSSGNYKPPYLPLYQTLDSIPVGRFCRTIVIPDDPAWVGLVDGVLSALSDAKVWRQFGTLTPEEMADAWLEMMADSWSTDTVPCCPEFAVDPSTGLLMQSDDGGLTFYRVPDGPYIDDGSAPYSSPPPPLNKGSDDADICQASANATAVIAQLYKETVGQVAADLFNTILDVNRFLFTVNQTLLRIIYPDAVQLGLASEWNAFDWATYATAPSLSDDNQAKLLCLLIDNATVTDGVVSFNHAGVITGTSVFDDNPGVAIELLINYIGGTGLNTAGGVMAVTDPDCDVCGWTFTFDFTVDDYSEFWTLASGGGSYSAGVGYVGHPGGASSRSDLTITAAWTLANIGTCTARYNKSGGSGVNNVSNFYFNHGGTTLVSNASDPAGTPAVKVTTINDMVDNLYFDINTGTTATTVTLLSVTFTGDGDNPFE